MGLSLLRNDQWQEVKAETYRRNRGRIPNPRRGGARLRACSHGRERGNHHTRVAFPRRLDRSLHRASFTALSGCATRWRARRIRPNLLPLCEVVQIGTQPVGSPAVGDMSGPGIRTASSGFLPPPEFSAVSSVLIDLVKAGKIRTPVTKTVAFSDATSALSEMEKGELPGKIVIRGV
jgi:hypothetical protein